MSMAANFRKHAVRILSCRPHYAPRNTIGLLRTEAAAAEDGAAVLLNLASPYHLPWQPRLPPPGCASTNHHTRRRRGSRTARSGGVTAAKDSTAQRKQRPRTNRQIDGAATLGAATSSHQPSDPWRRRPLRRCAAGEILVWSRCGAVDHGGRRQSLSGGSPP
jgi:hypothetical protein